MESNQEPDIAKTDDPPVSASSGAVGPSITIGRGELRPAQLVIGSLTILVPFLGTVAACIHGYYYGVRIGDLVTLGVMFTLTNFGLEFGFHRNLAHRAFKTSPFISTTFAVLGSMAGTGRLLFWVANHRRHHKFSDVPGDPHSPHVRLGKTGPQKLGLMKGLLHAHYGHILYDDLSNCTYFAGDINRNRNLAWINRWYGLLVLVGLAIPSAVGALLGGGLGGALRGFLWGGLVRMFLVHHATWSLASFSHRFGARPFENGDQSANNIVVAIASFGSGYQNNHHAFPTSAFLGLNWWSADPTAWLIGIFRRLGLVWDVRSPSKPEIDERRAYAVALRAQSAAPTGE